MNPGVDLGFSRGGGEGGGGGGVGFQKIFVNFIRST